MTEARTTTLGLDAWLARFDAAAPQIDTLETGPRVFRAAAPGKLQTALGHRIALILRGEAVCIFGSSRLDLHPGAAVWIQPGSRYAWHWMENASVLQIAFNLDVPGATPRLEPTHLHSLDAWSLRDRLEQVFEELALPMPQSPRRIKWLLALAVTDMMRQSTRYAHAGALSPNQRNRLVRLVSQRGVAPLAVGELADELGLSDDYFTRRFRRTFNQSPRSWLMRQRMLAAARLLRQSGLTITQAGAAAGYTDLSQFSRQFRRTLGVAPSRYRRG